MIESDIGFVLKRFQPNKQKVSVLSRTRGKIEIVTRPYDKISKLWPGMMFSFDYEKNKNHGKVSFIKNIEIIMNPSYNSLREINWMHTLLELCYYFVPLEEPNFEVFVHIENCFRMTLLYNMFLEEISTIRRVYILKLLELFGFYPEKKLVPCLGICKQLSCTYIDFMDSTQVNSVLDSLQDVKKHNTCLESWIFKCIKSHPNFKNFKTSLIKPRVKSC